MDGMRPENASHDIDRAVAQLAARRHGILTLPQLLQCGVGQRGISRRVAASRLFRLHRGVYSLVPPRLLRIEGRWLAAVEACGPGAVLSHTAAAALWDVCAPPSGPVHVSAPTANGRARRDGIVLHRATTLLPSQTTMRRGIPVTKPARTLQDLRRLFPRSRFEAAVRRAEKLRLDTGAVRDPQPQGDFNVLERRFLALCRRHSLPRPGTQRVIGPYTVDFLWPDAGLVVEVDGFGDHGTRSGFEADRARDAQLKLLGYDVVRFTWRQLRDDAATVVGVLRGLLQR
jgi:very-short-patch-repair endonuclease